MSGVHGICLVRCSLGVQLSMGMGRSTLRFVFAAIFRPTLQQKLFFRPKKITGEKVIGEFAQWRSQNWVAKDRSPPLRVLVLVAYHMI